MCSRSTAQLWRWRLRFQARNGGACTNNRIYIYIYIVFGWTTCRGVVERTNTWHKPSAPKWKSAEQRNNKRGAGWRGEETLFLFLAPPPSRRTDGRTDGGLVFDYARVWSRVETGHVGRTILYYYIRWWHNYCLSRGRKKISL